MGRLSRIIKLARKLDFRRHDFPISDISPSIQMYKDTRSDIERIKNSSKLRRKAKQKLLKKLQQKNKKVVLRIDHVIQRYKKTSDILDQACQKINTLLRACTDPSSINELNRLGLLESLSHVRTVVVPDLVIDEDGEIILCKLTNYNYRFYVPRLPANNSHDDNIVQVPDAELDAKPLVENSMKTNNDDHKESDGHESEDWKEQYYGSDDLDAIELHTIDDSQNTNTDNIMYKQVSTQTSAYYHHDNQNANTHNVIYEQVLTQTSPCHDHDNQNDITDDIIYKQVSTQTNVTILIGGPEEVKYGHDIHVTEPGSSKTSPNIDLLDLQICNDDRQFADILADIIKHGISNAKNTYEYNHPYQLYDTTQKPEEYRIETWEKFPTTHNDDNESDYFTADEF